MTAPVLRMPSIEYGTRIPASWGEINYEYEIRRTPIWVLPGLARLTVAVASPSSGTFYVTRGGRIAAWMKRHGISREMQTGDPAFDQQCYVVADDDSVPLAYFTDPGRREAVCALLRAGFTRVEYTPGEVRAIWDFFQVDKHFRSDPVSGAARHLAVLACDVPVLPQSATAARMRTRRRIVRTIAIVSTILGATWLTFGRTISPPLDFDAMLLHSLRLSLPVLAPFLVISVFVLRRGSHAVLIQVILASLFGFLFVGFGVSVMLNALRDATPAQGHAAMIVLKSRGRYPALQVKSWRPGHGTEWVPVSRGLFRTVSPGDVVVVETHAGRLGFEWISDCRVSARRAPSVPLP